MSDSEDEVSVSGSEVEEDDLDVEMADDDAPASDYAVFAPRNEHVNGWVILDSRVDQNQWKRVHIHGVSPPIVNYIGYGSNFVSVVSELFVALL
ncbi:hypothetical protein Y032_0188g1140 [Ancylostoma ceylanicum]|uniref:Uncharacterized protein n=1 Tax=Ancylostoma ceylanicum TaxID=53326 RepID=A0A016SQS3_9BILA|nr:hypothetical protein Y032_0188g1140 [Ancylostoma ceylanicum]